MKRLVVAALLAPLLPFSAAQAEITYADILADPDNPSLNQQFARQRLEQGDAKAALAAVERVLVAEPTNLGARLFRAEILAALGADLQAEGELLALAAMPLPDSIKARVNALQAALENRRKRLKTQVNLAFGFQSNDNATNWPAESNVLFQGSPLPASNPYTQERFGEENNPITDKQTDTATNGTVAVTSSYDLARETFRDVFINLGASQTGDSDTVYLDNTSTNIGFGLTYKSGALTLVPRLSVVDVENEFEDRLGNYEISSGSLTAGWQLGERHRLTLAVGGTELQFDGSKKTNDTLTHSATLGYAGALTPTVTLNLGLFDQDVDGGRNRDENGSLNMDLDKKLTGVSASTRFALARGQFLTLGGSYSEAEHDNAYSQSISATDQVGKKREDKISNLSASYLLLAGAFVPQLSNMFVTLAYQQNGTRSNILGFSQKRNIASLNVTYTLNF